MFLKQPEVNPMSHCSHTMECSSNLVGGNNVCLILLLLGIYFKLKKNKMTKLLSFVADIFDSK